MKTYIVINEYNIKAFKAHNNYDIYDPKSFFIYRFFLKIIRTIKSSLKMFTPFEIEITHLNGQKVFN